MKLYEGRLPKSLNTIAQLLNNSLSFDRRMAMEDVIGSMAWAKAIQRVGILTPEEAESIQKGLSSIQKEFESDQFVFLEGDEDIHTAVERRLTELIGAPASKLHTGRSRNDQVVTDFRLWMNGAVQRTDTQIVALQGALLDRAEKDFGVIINGYTHFQRAQPILLSHFWLSHFFPLARDRQRFADLRQRMDKCPLGSGALAGTAFPVNRVQLAQDLGFSAPTENSLDAVSDRDFAAEFLFNTTLMATHLSRLAEALILYSTAEYGFVTLADEYSTGSSLMPQKKNPDPLELIRAKSAELLGRLTGFLATLKALPSAYDKDLQEDKPAVFDAADRLDVLLPVMRGVLETLTIHEARCRQAIDWQLLATDIADYLVRKDVPFRQAHAAVGQLVRQSQTSGIPLPELPLKEWQLVNPAFGEDVFETFDIEMSVSRRNALGGTAPDRVRESIIAARKSLDGAVSKDFF